MSRRLSVIGLLAALLLASCTGPSTHQPAPHTEHNGPVGPVPAGLQPFYGQSLHWGPCTPYAGTQTDRAAFRGSRKECAHLTVPLDYTRPQGRTITLGLLRVRATDPAHRIGSLLVNPGGPGASGMSAAASLAPQVRNTELGQRFDLVGFDPRGVGASRPQLRCLTGPERDAERRDNDVDTSPAGIARTEAEEHAYDAKCAQRSGKDLLEHAGSRDVSRDMDVLRSALGDPKLNYLGFSYGTRIGADYAEQFPGNVRAMLLDGAIDPRQSQVDELVSQGAGFQQAFDAFSRWCSGRAHCAVGHDPRQANAAFQRLVRPLIAHPAEIGDGRKLSYSDATTAVMQALYEPDLWQPMNAGLRQLAEGDGSKLAFLADAYYGRQRDGHYSNTTAAFDAVRCVDDPRVTDRSRTLATDRRYRRVAPFLDDGHGPSAALDKCAFWPVPPTGEPHQPQVTGLPPTLVVSTTGDPATPYQAGADLARALHGDLLTFEGTQHTAFLQGNPCVDAVGTRYLVDLQRPRPGKRCR